MGGVIRNQVGFVLFHNVFLCFFDFTISAATVDQVHCMKVCGCITVLVATLAVIVRVYGLPGEI